MAEMSMADLMTALGEAASSDVPDKVKIMIYAATLQRREQQWVVLWEENVVMRNDVLG